MTVIQTNHTVYSLSHNKVYTTRDMPERMGVAICKNPERKSRN